MTETIAERQVREKIIETAGFADYLANNADATASVDGLEVRGRTPVTQRFEPILDILTPPAPEPTRTARAATEARAFVQRNSSILTFVAGLLTGTVLALLR